MRAAIGLFAALAVLGGAASAASPGIETAGLFTPLPAGPSETLIWRVVKIKCTCGKLIKTVKILEADYCPQGMKPTCDCTSNPPTATCPKAHN